MTGPSRRRRRARPWPPPTSRRVEPIAALEKLMGCPDLASRRWIWEQYDHLVMGHTVHPARAAMPPWCGSAPAPRALALTTDCTPRYCQADPETGGAQAVAESWRNITAVGGRPLAVTDNMNFGNPQRPEIMGQFAGCIEGIRKACLALDYPVVSGNVSLLQRDQRQGHPAHPGDRRRRAGGGCRQDRLHRLQGRGRSHCPYRRNQGPSRLLALSARDPGPRGRPPAAGRSRGRAAASAISSAAGSRPGELTACHDLADGGLLVAVAEMALAGDASGAEITLPRDIPAHGFCFGEDQARYLVDPARGQRWTASSRRPQGAGVPAIGLGPDRRKRVDSPGR